MAGDSREFSLATLLASPVTTRWHDAMGEELKMIFTPENCEKMLAGLKTNTRRVAKKGERLINQHGSVMPDPIWGWTLPWGVEDKNGRLKWEIGKTYAIQPGRGKKSLGRFLLTDIRKERLRDICYNYKDARAEGFTERGTSLFIPADIRFAEYWDTIHKPGERWEDDPEVWVLTMELVEGSDG